MPKEYFRKYNVLWYFLFDYHFVQTKLATKRLILARISIQCSHEKQMIRIICLSGVYLNNFLIDW